MQGILFIRRTAMDEERKIQRDIERAATNYKLSDNGRWLACYFASRVVGSYRFGATLELSERMGVSVDTVENLAHAWEMYAEFRAVPEYRNAVRAIRKMPYIYYSYFRALYRAKMDYGLDTEKLFMLLNDILQAEGDFSLKDLEIHLIDRYGDSRDWTYWGKKAHKAIHKALQQPDLPKRARKKLRGAYEVLGDMS